MNGFCDGLDMENIGILQIEKTPFNLPCMFWPDVKLCLDNQT
jgi:hypothetical protein